jgi:ribosomal protein L3 glutamine methyltransferase
MKIKNDSIKELITIKDFIRYGTSEFNKAKLHFGHGTDNSWDETAWLVAHALHLSPQLEEKFLDARLTENEKFEIFELLHRRIKERKPAAYLINEAWFAGLNFYVDERVLIPRSSLAELILNKFSPWVNEEQVTRILDVGTGSGCIAIACAHAFPEAKVDAIDISPGALEVAEKNIAKYHLARQVKLLKSDIFASLKNEIYDIIISNPPYVSKGEMKGLPEEYKHEPKMALEAGSSGLEIVAKILSNAAKHLSPHGILVVEVGNSEDAVRKQYPRLPFTWLEFERGEGGVFLLTADQLREIS